MDAEGKKKKKEKKDDGTCWTSRAKCQINDDLCTKLQTFQVMGQKNWVCKTIYVWVKLLFIVK